MSNIFNNVLRSMFKRKNVQQLLLDCLYEERLSMLEQQEAFEHAKAMMTYHALRISQLKAHVTCIANMEKGFV